MSKSKHRGWADIVIEESDTPKKRIKTLGLLEQGQVRVKDVLILPCHEDIDDKLASLIAESFPFTSGPINPITVRRVREQKDGEEFTKTVLVTGAQRLQAARLAGLRTINCTYIDGDEIDARLARIAENLFRKHQTVLQHAEMLTEWLSFAVANFTGQVVHEGKGRSLSGIAKAARALPLVGRSVEARRKILDRAIQIARLPPEIKKAAKKAGLANNQRALIKIAKAKGQKAQLTKIEGLTGRSQKSNSLPQQASEAPTIFHDELQGEAGDAVQSPPLQSAPDGAVADVKSEAADEPIDTPEKRRTTTFDELEKFWEREGHKLWAYAPNEERGRFIEKLRRAKCHAQVDVVAFIRDVFWGRKEIAKPALYAFAKVKGLSKVAVQKALRNLCYRQKRKGQGAFAVWYLRNNNQDWKEQQKIVSDAELGAARVAHPDLKKMTAPKGAQGRHKALHDYYSNI